MVIYQKSNRAVSTNIFIVFAVIILGIFIVVSYSTFSSIAKLQSEQDSLLTELSNLQSSYNDLESDYQTLNSALSGISNNYQNLQNLYTSLTLEHNELQTAYEELIGKAPIGEGIRIDSVYWWRGVLAEAGVRNVVIRNLGSTEVTVISLKLYYNEVLQSSAALSVIIPANSTVKIEKFLPPSARSSLYLYILKVETLEGYVAISDPLPLCQ